MSGATGDDETVDLSTPGSGLGSAVADTPTCTERTAVGEARLHVTRTATTTRIGRFQVLELLGHGGMGMVFAAYDELLDRKVAVKVLDKGLRDEVDQRRLQREAQALARLTHPNVVTVHDVGHSDGRLFLAMEFVRGQSIRTWLRSAPQWRTVLDAFIQVGHGLAAAHRAGLIHRDLKPSNIVRSDEGVVKVLDFGLARTSGEADELVEESPSRDSASPLHSSLTQTGTIMGTPAYMPPEQHVGTNLDARSDQYSFCVALWEGLVGSRPFVSKTYEGLLRAKRAGPPSWPEGAPALPGPMVEAVRRGLQPEPEARWPSMSDLLAVLEHEPVGRASWGWELFVMFAVGLLGWSLVARPGAGQKPCSGASEQLAGIWDDTRREALRGSMLAIEGPYVAAAWERTRDSLDEHAAGWTRMYTEACEAALRKERSEAMLDLQMTCLRGARNELSAVAGTLVSADASVVQKSHELVANLSPLSRCTDLGTLTADVAPPSLEEAEEVDSVRRELAKATASRVAARHDDAQRHMQLAEDIVKTIDYGPVRTTLLLERGFLLESKGEYEASAAVLDDAIASAVEWKQIRPLARAAMLAMDVNGVSLGKSTEGLRYWGVIDGATRNDSSLRGSALNNLGLLLSSMGHYDQAEEKIREALQFRLEHGPDPNGVAQARNNLAAALFYQHRVEEAESESRLAARAWEELLGPDHPKTAQAYANLGTMLQVQGRRVEAEVEFRRALSIFEGALGPTHSRVVLVRTSMANLMLDEGRPAEAEVELRQALSALEQSLGPGHRHVGSIHNNIGSVLEAQQQYTEAEAEFRSAHAIFTEALGPEHPDTLLTHFNIANALHHRGRLDEAENEFRRLLGVLEAAKPQDSEQLATAQMGLAELLMKRDQAREALALVERAWALSRHDVPPETRGHAAYLLARLQWEQGSHAEAQALAHQALEQYEQVALRPKAAAVRAWLDEHSAP